MNVSYYLTHHAIERFQQRFDKITSKVPVLKNWKKNDGVGLIKQFFDRLIDLSEENRSYINNSTHMLHLYTKYGYDNDFKFLEFKPANLLFVLTKDRNKDKYLLATITPIDFKPSQQSTKYLDKSGTLIAYENLLKVWSKVGQKIESQPISTTIQSISSKEFTDTELSLILHYHVKNKFAISKKNEETYITYIGNKEVEFEVLPKNQYVWKKQTTLDQQSLEYIEQTKEISSYSALYKALIHKLHDQKTTVYETVTLDDTLYNLKIIKNNDLPTRLIIESARFLTEEEIRLNYANIKPLDKSLSMYETLSDATNKSNFTVLEKYHHALDLRMSLINDKVYTCVYNRNDKNFYIKNIDSVINNDSLKLKNGNTITIKDYFKDYRYTSTRSEITNQSYLLTSDKPTYQKFINGIESGEAKIIKTVSPDNNDYQIRLNGHIIIFNYQNALDKILVKSKRELTREEVKSLITNSNKINIDEPLYQKINLYLSTNNFTLIGNLDRDTSIRCVNIEDKEYKFYYVKTKHSKNIYLFEINELNNEVTKNYTLSNQSVIEKINQIKDNHNKKNHTLEM